jgi:hypothetical protein
VTDILLSRANLDTEGTYRTKDNVKRYREKIVLYKPRKEAWNRSFPDRSQKEPGQHLDFGLLASRTVTQ